jgi:hypothetical protein
MPADGVRGLVQATIAALLLSGHAHIWGAAALGSIPCVLVALVPRVRAVHRTPAGEIVVDA